MIMAIDVIQLYQNQPQELHHEGSDQRGLSGSTGRLALAVSPANPTRASPKDRPSRT